MSAGCSFVDADFLDKSSKIKDLGEGTFGSVALYNTPHGQYVIKKTKLVDKSLGYPPDLLAEVDMLIKLRSLDHVVKLEGACFDLYERKGFILLEPLDGHLYKWAKQQSFNRRIKYLPRLIQQIGGVIGLMHRFEFVHDDIKTNNILVKEESNGPIFKLADFGKARLVLDERRPYGGIERYRPPTHRNIYVSESWAFMVCLIEVILGYKMNQGEDIKDFYSQHTHSDKFDVRRFLKRELSESDYQNIPKCFWSLVRRIITPDKETPHKLLSNVLDRIDLGISSSDRRGVKEGLSRHYQGQIHDSFGKIAKEFYARFEKAESKNLYKSFVYLLNKFLWKVPPLNLATLRCYAEVAMVILLKSKVKSFLYFKDQAAFLEFERALLATIGFQIMIKAD